MYVCTKVRFMAKRKKKSYKENIVTHDGKFVCISIVSRRKIILFAGNVGRRKILCLYDVCR